MAASLVHIYHRAFLSSTGCDSGLTFITGSKKNFIREESCPSISNAPPAIELILKCLEKGPCTMQSLELCGFSFALQLWPQTLKDNESPSSLRVGRKDLLKL